MTELDYLLEIQRREAARCDAIAMAVLLLVFAVVWWVISLLS